MISVGYEYCLWDCRSLGNFTIILFNTAVALLLTLYVARNSYLSWKQNDFNVNKAIYLLMLAWGVGT